MSDLIYPHCKHEQEVNHDDGYGYEEDEKRELEPFGDKWPDMYDCKNCDHYQKGLS